MCLITSTQRSPDPGYVVIVSPPFFGHLIPLLDLAKTLSQYHHVTFVLSSSKLDDLKRRELIPKIVNLEFIRLFDNNDEDYQISDSTAATHIEPILNRMAEPLREFFFLPSSSTPVLTNRFVKHPIDLVIFDPFVPITVKLAHQQQIPAHAFITTNLLHIQRSIDLSTGKAESTVITPKFAQQMVESLSLSDGVICNSVYELDKTILNDIYQKSLLNTSIPVRFVAPIISQSNEHQTTEHIQNWLDIQRSQSSNSTPFIIYVSFGSLAVLKREQLVELAHALQNYSVIWSLKSHLQSHLPTPFINNSNHLLLNWSPQRYILSQSAVRLFISHGGWNSLLESMSAGKITLIWPMFGDQFSNGYRLETELHAGRSVKNLTDINQERILSRCELESYLKDIVDNEMIYFSKAQHVQEMFRNAQETNRRQSFEEINQIVDFQRFKRLNQHNEL